MVFPFYHMTVILEAGSELNESFTMHPYTISVVSVRLPLCIGFFLSVLKKKPINIGLPLWWILTHCIMIKRGPILPFYFDTFYSIWFWRNNSLIIQQTKTLRLGRVYFAVQWPRNSYDFLKPYKLTVRVGL